MKWIKRILLTLLLLIIVLIGVQYLNYRSGIAKVKQELPGRSQVVQTSNGPVEYLRQGNGNRYILLIHGTPGSYHTFMADALVEQGFTVLSPSRPGYFRTPLSSGETIAEQADLYAGLLDALRIDSAAILGFSGGGPSALDFAIRHPNRCTGLIVMASAGRSFPEIEQHWLEEVITSSEFGKWTLFSMLSGNFKTEEAGEEARNYVRTAMFPVSQTEAGEMNDMKQFVAPKTYDLSSVQCPTLIIHGTQDELIPYSEAEYMDQQIPNSTLMRREGQDHFTVVFFEFRENLIAAGEFLMKRDGNQE